MRYSKYNVIIVGSGISGLFLANKLAKNSNFSDGILLITKENLFSGSSPLAQGGIVTVVPELNPKDSVELHVKDTISAGCGLNNINTVGFVSNESAFALQELMSFGVEFDRNENNTLNFTLEAAHSCPRILHAKGDSTGKIIEETLCERLKHQKNVEIYDNTMALELLVDNNNCARGLIAYNWQNNYYEAIYSNAIIIATGGIGQIYKNTTNPSVSTGDGIALAYRAGADVENMEFVQFHPTALYCKDKKTLPLVSESARGEGAELVDLNGNYFAKTYHHLGSLAPRDIVARAIKTQMEQTNANFVNLDISQIGIEKFKQRFPTITRLCEENEIDISNGLIPVAPAQHYFMGGIKVDLNSKTNIDNLYAIGECSSTGLHGANRLASNSLLECVVFANTLSDLLSKEQNNPPKKNDEQVKKVVDKYAENNDFYDDNQTLIEDLFAQLKSTMTNFVGIERSYSTLNFAYESIENIEKELKIRKMYASRRKYELENAICVSKLIIIAALKRDNSIGAHYRADNKQYEINNKELKNDEILVK